MAVEYRGLCYSDLSVINDEWSYLNTLCYTGT